MIFFVENHLFAQSSSNKFSGIWEGEDRILVFDSDYLLSFLKPFYGWYIDLASENPQNQTVSPQKNDTTFLDIQNIKVEFFPIIQNENSCAFELEFNLPQNRKKIRIPVAIINDNLYLDFAIKENLFENFNENSTENLNEENSINQKFIEENSISENLSENLSEQNLSNEFLKKSAKISGIKISEPLCDKEIFSYLFVEDSIYKIRYWKTDMDFSNENATFSDAFNFSNDSDLKNSSFQENKSQENQKTFSVPKHIKSAGNVYTCAPGRSTKIRNVEKLTFLEIESLKSQMTFSEEKNIVVFGAPYLSKISDDTSAKNIVNLVESRNSRRAPNPNPPFEPSNLDWHLDDITRLELNNKIIQAVRERQKEFYKKYGHGLKF